MDYQNNGQCQPWSSSLPLYSGVILETTVLIISVSSLERLSSVAQQQQQQQQCVGRGDRLKHLALLVNCSLRCSTCFAWFVVGYFHCRLFLLAAFKNSDWRTKRTHTETREHCSILLCLLVLYLISIFQCHSVSHLPILRASRSVRFWMYCREYVDILKFFYHALGPTQAVINICIRRIQRLRGGMLTIALESCLISCTAPRSFTLLQVLVAEE